MRELERVLNTIVTFVLDIVGMVLHFLVRMANYGVGYYDKSDILGKLLALLLLVFVAWLIYFFVHMLLHTAARYALIAIAVVLIAALLLSAVNNPHNFALR